MTLDTTSTPPPAPLSGASIANEAEARVAELHREAEAASDRALKAVLLYEAAYLTETRLGQPGHAVQVYLASYNLDHRFRLPLYALSRMFERRRSFKNLSRLYDAELRSARTPQEKATALIGQAALSVLNGGDQELVRACLERAFEQDSTADGTLLLEWNRLSAHDADGALAALIRRAEACDDPVHRGVLLVEVAAHRERTGELASALEALKSAASGAHGHEGFHVALARFARAHNFVPELVEATERRAELAERELNERLSDSEVDHALIERLRARTVALWYEAARLRCTSLSDAEGALSCVGKALDIRPDDLLLRQTRMLAYDLTEDRQRAADEARSLLAEGSEGEHAATLHFRLAEDALVQGNTQGARESLMEAIAQAGGSIAADVILDDLLFDEERHHDRIERREARAVAADEQRASRWLLEAAQIATYELKDGDKALELYRRADAKTPGSMEVLREAYGAALELDHPALARFALDSLLARELDDDERAAFLHHRIDVAETAEEATTLLDAHLSDTRLGDFLPHLARVRAAEGKSFGLLSRAHETLAERAAGSDQEVSHLCGAARASLRLGDTVRARALLERAIARAPSHRYALTLLEEVLRQSGESGQVVELLRKAAASQESARDAELSLLMAGAAAEGAQSHEMAAQRYEEAADRNPGSVGPLWALLRLGLRTSDAGLELRAREGLAARERADGHPGIETLLVADHYEFKSQKPELADLARTAALDDIAVGHHAAVGLLLSRSAGAEVRDRAASLLEGRASGAQKRGWLRELGGSEYVHGVEHAKVLDVLERVTTAQADDRWASWTRASLPLPGAPSEHAEALSTFARVTSDARIADLSRAEALCARRLEGESGELDPLLSELGVEADLSPHMAHVATSHASLRRDAKLRARALSAQATSGGTPSDEHTRALARARLSAGEAGEAVALLEQRLREDPDDLAALELLRVAARRANRFDLAAQAAERLSEELDGELWAQLLEESAAIHMDMLDDAQKAEALLARVLEKFPARPIAYGRMHDLLGDLGDTQALITLVEGRTGLIDDAEELARLFYELARLHRASGDLDAALDNLDHLGMLEEHVGGLALAAEIHTSRENWRGAVDALEALAGAHGVPKAQRRLARLGAADFLENRLNDGAAALAQLETLLRDGHGDTALHTRIANVAERLGNLDRAASALLAASGLAKADAGTELMLRAAELLAKTGKKEEAVALYRRAIDAKPAHLGAVTAFLSLNGDPSTRSTVLSRFEIEVRAELRAQPLSAEPLRKLLGLAALKAQDDMTFIALSTLLTIGSANATEREAADAALRRAFGARPHTSSPVTAAELRELLSPALDDRYVALSRAVFSAAAQIDELEPGRFGVGRGQRVSAREPNQVRDELSAMTGALTLRLGDFYVGGEEPTRVVAMPRDDELAFLVGVGVTAPLSPTRRYQLALQVAGSYLVSLPLLSRTPAQGARLVFAAMAASEVQLPENALREPLGELPRFLGKALPRRVKKAIPDLVRALPDFGANAENHCRMLLRHTRRIALLLSGDLRPVLEHVVGATPPPDTIAQSEEALDVVRAWTSAPMATLRNRLGLAR